MCKILLAALAASALATGTVFTQLTDELTHHLL